jgi:hypothetical protein
MPRVDVRSLDAIARSVLKQNGHGPSSETFHKEFLRRVSEELPETQMSATIVHGVLKLKPKGWAPTFYVSLSAVHKSSNQTPLMLDAWATLLPVRIANEDLADYIEDINRRIVRGQRALVHVRVAAAIFWTGINALGYLLRQLRSTKRGA